VESRFESVGFEQCCATHPVNPDFESLSPVRRLFCHSAAILCLASGPLSRVLVAGSADGVDQDLDDPRLRPVARLSGHEIGVTRVSLNCIRTLLLSSSTDRTTGLWSLCFGRCLALLRGFTTSAVNGAAF
jgi:WD40 repeat protein